jgi:outer membrane protein OmpA-like peptidoglycan-associated protein
LVFFDWDSAVVGPSGREVIGLAAQTYKAGSPVAVQVTGFTDTSGSADYNQRLSVRRADAVAAVLVQDGVPQNALVVTGRGQNGLRVPTPDGVREPQNRRVEIVEGGPPGPVSMR